MGILPPSMQMDERDMEIILLGNSRIYELNINEVLACFEKFFWHCQFGIVPIDVS